MMDLDPGHGTINTLINTIGAIYYDKSACFWTVGGGRGRTSTRTQGERVNLYTGSNMNSGLNRGTLQLACSKAKMQMYEMFLKYA